jgi:hypothetical protein
VRPHRVRVIDNSSPVALTTSLNRRFFGAHTASGEHAKSRSVLQDRNFAGAQSLAPERSVSDDSIPIRCAFLHYV